MNSLCKTPVEAVTQNKHTVQYEVLTDIGQIVQDTNVLSDTEQTYGTIWSIDRHWRDSKNTSESSDTEPTDGTLNVLTDRRYTVQDTIVRSDTEPTAVEYEILTEIGETLQDTSGRTEPEPTDCPLWGTDKIWTDCTSHQWTQWHRINRRYNMKSWHTVDRLYKTPVNRVSQNQQIVHCDLVTDIGQTV